MVVNDPQQERLYAAEVSVPFGRILTLKEIRQEIHQILCSPWWTNLAPEITNVVVMSAGGKRAQSWTIGGVGFISFPPYTRCELVMLHELAHLAQYTAEPHGPEFARLYLLTVAIWAPSLYSDLYRAIHAHGVQVTPFDQTQWRQA